MSDAQNELAERVHDMVRAYVMRKTEARCQISWDTFKASKSGDVQQRYSEARQKVCMNAFLAVRSRRSREEFRDYFVATLCAVPQFLPDAEYLRVAQAVSSDRWEDVRSLAMLALSAHSYVRRTPTE